MRKALLVTLFAMLFAVSAVPSCNIDNFTESLPLFYIGTSYNLQIQACCGTPPYTFTVYSGTLPPGLTMSSSGVISGTPTAASSGIFCITITDSVGCHLTYCYQVDSE